MGSPGWQTPGLNGQRRLTKTEKTGHPSPSPFPDTQTNGQTGVLLNSKAVNAFA